MGKRSFYVIGYANQYYRDDVNIGIIFLTQNLKEAIKRFEYLYNVTIEEYTNEEGDIWADHSYTINTNESTGKTYGHFDFYEDSGSLRYILTTLHTDAFASGWDIEHIESEMMEKSYHRRVGE